MTKGVRQCPLSAPIFCQMSWPYNTGMRRRNSGDRRVGILLYADDIPLIAASGSE